MNILLVNDDGYMAEGIKTLERVLSSYGHKIYMTAPSVEQSAKSHSMTINSHVFATEFDDGHFHLSGSPADCIIYSLKSNLLPIKPDLIVSGINHGYNLSSDIIYSGTCAAARQACLYGYKAIAISTNKNKDGEYDFESPAKFLAENLESFASRLDSSAFLNINVPPVFNGEYELSSIGLIDYDDQFSLEKMEDGRIRISNIACVMTYEKLGNAAYPHDWEICKSGRAAVSFVKILPEISEHHTGAFCEA